MLRSCNSQRTMEIGRDDLIMYAAFRHLCIVIEIIYQIETVVPSGQLCSPNDICETNTP